MIVDRLAGHDQTYSESSLAALTPREGHNITSPAGARYRENAFFGDHTNIQLILRSETFETQNVRVETQDDLKGAVGIKVGLDDKEISRPQHPYPTLDLRQIDLDGV